MLKRSLTAAALRLLPLLQGRERGLFLASDREGRTTGLRLNWRAASPGMIEGAIVSFEKSGQRFRFFVADEVDTIQKCFVRGGFYEEQELELIAAHFPGGVFVDVGGNVGNHSVYAAKLLKADKVIAFEPNSLAAEMCEINLALNGCSGTVDLHRFGLSDGESRGTLHAERHNLGGARLRADEDGDVQLFTGDSLLQDEPVTFIKIDVEGHELQVLGGLSETIRRRRPALFVEVDAANVSGFARFCDEHRYRVVDQFRRYDTCENLLVLPVEGAE